MILPENPELYEAAKQIMHRMGLPWRDPRTGVTYHPPKARNAQPLAQKDGENGDKSSSK